LNNQSGISIDPSVNNTRNNFFNLTAPANGFGTIPQNAASKLWADTEDGEGHN